MMWLGGASGGLAGCLGPLQGVIRVPQTRAAGTEKRTRHVKADGVFFVMIVLLFHRSNGSLHFTL